MRRVSAPSDRVAIIGAGASELVPSLIASGYTNLVAVDIAQPALDQLARRLADTDAAPAVTMMCADVRHVAFAEPVDVWHDRATFHFLTDSADQSAYVDRAAAAVRPGGHVVLATFALDGPSQCSGLDVAHYDADQLADRFAGPFVGIDSMRHVHVTPWGAEQPFTYVVLRRR